MNTNQINTVLTKHVKYFQGIYPIDLLPSTLINPSIIVINLAKYYMPDSNWVAVVFPTLGTPNILIRTVCHPTNSKPWHSYNATQFLGHLTATDYRV